MALTRIRAEQISDIDYKQAVRVVTTTNITLSGGAPNTVDSVSLSVNDRILVTAQSTGSQNGIYVVQALGTGSNGTWARSSDANQTGEIEAGMIVMVTDGTVYADTQWVLSTNNPIIIGTTPLTFQQNISTTGNIAQGNSSIRILSNSNVLINVSGVPNVAVFYNDGLSITGNVDVSKNVVVTGNLTVNGTTTTINSNVITTNDKTFTLANNQSTSAGVDGSGIEVGSPPVASFYYNNATTSWQSNVGLTPTGNATLNLGGASNLWSTVYSNNVSALSTVTSTTITATGNIVGGNIITSGTLSATTAVIGNILPIANVLYDLGSPTNQWRTLYVSGNTIFIGDSTITSNATSISLNNPLGGSFSISGNSPANTVGSFGSVSATGNVVSGNILTSGIVSATGTITGGSLTTVGNVNGGNLISEALVQGVTLSATGNVIGGNINTTGLVSATGAVTGGSLTTAGTINATGNITGGNILTAGNISATGTVTGSTLNVSSADLAELYASDSAYAPGTVLDFGGNYEVTVSSTTGSNRIAGVVSTSPASLMNSLLESEFTVPLALTGRVPTSVTGTVRKGDMMISAGDGTAIACAQPVIGSVIGKALEDFSGEAGVIEVVVGRL